MPTPSATAPAGLQGISTIGFIGLGVMGEPMCGHLARRSKLKVLAYDLRPDPLRRLMAPSQEPVAIRAASMREIAETCDITLLSLPDGNAVASVVAALGPHLKPGQCVVDTSTSPVELTRQIGAELAAKGILYADAPVARTREAAARGELSIMVGATPETFAHIRPILETMGSDVTYCGPVGCGQVVKILNNMLVFQHCAALAEAIAIGRRNGVPADVLLPTMALGSGDSFVLRNHGMKSMLTETFPERAFSTRYAIKDLSYALAMAEDSGLDMAAAKLTMARLRQAEEAGYGDLYHPVVLKVIDL